MNDLPLIRSDNYLPLIAGKLWEELPQVIWGGLLFSALSIPAFVLFSLKWIFPAIALSILMVSPAWAALLAYEFRLLQGHAVKWHDFWDALQKYWLRSVGLGCAGVFPLLVAVLKLPLLNTDEIPTSLWVSFAADFFAGGLVAALSLYVFPLLVRNNWGLIPTLRNSWVLMARHLTNTLGILGLGILFGFALGSISLGLIFLLPAIYGLFCVGNCELVLQQEAVD